MPRARTDQSPEVIEGAALRYAPVNEMGVVFLFAQLHRRYGVRVDHIQAAFPDCIAYQKVGGKEKAVRIEFEYRSKNFKLHRHDPKKCDWIVCWEHDWPDYPRNLRIIELRKEFGLGFNVWIQPLAAPYTEEISKRQPGRPTWSTSSLASKGDLILFYRKKPDMFIQDIFVIDGEVDRVNAQWKKGKDYMAPIKRVTQLKAPVFLADLRRDPVLKTAGFVRGSMQGRPRATEYWPYLYQMICSRNPAQRKALVEYSPEARFL